VSILGVAGTVLTARRGKYGQDIFTLKTACLEGRPPKSASMYWRRLAMDSIPLDDPKKFETWMLEQWRIKDELLEVYMQTGRFPRSANLEITSPSGADVVSQTGRYIETRLETARTIDYLQLFIPMAVVVLAMSLFLGRESFTWIGGTAGSFS
jgi:lysocardiolipin and lysophospholipid acyltransferase